MNTKTITEPKKKDEEVTCIRFHSLGYCFKDCRFMKGHGELDNNEAQGIVNFMDKARERCKKFLKNQWGQPGNSQGSPATNRAESQG